MADQRLTALVARAFATAWPDRKKALEREWAQLQVRFAQHGMGRSSSLMDALTNAGSNLLEVAWTELWSAVERSLSSGAVLADAITTPDITQAIRPPLDQVLQFVDNGLRKAAANMGFPTKWSVAEKYQRLLAKTGLEADLLLPTLARLEAELPARPLQPWYQRPVGIVVLGVIASILAFLLIALLR